RLRQQVVERREPVFPAVVLVAGPVEPLAELGGQRSQPLVGALLHGRLEACDLRDERFERLALTAFAGVEELLEQAHTTAKSTGASDAIDRRYGSRTAKMRPCHCRSGSPRARSGRTSGHVSEA